MTGLQQQRHSQCHGSTPREIRHTAPKRPKVRRWACVPATKKVSSPQSGFKACRLSRDVLMTQA